MDETNHKDDEEVSEQHEESRESSVERDGKGGDDRESQSEPSSPQPIKKSQKVFDRLDELKHEEIVDEKPCEYKYKNPRNRCKKRTYNHDSGLCRMHRCLVKKKLEEMEFKQSLKKEREKKEKEIQELSDKLSEVSSQLSEATTSSRRSFTTGSSLYGSSMTSSGTTSSSSNASVKTVQVGNRRNARKSMYRGF